VVSDGGGQQFRDGQFNDESRAYREIIFNMDAAAMLSDDARGDGQAEARAAPLG